MIVLPISEKYLDYAKTVVSKLSEKDLRVELDISSESVGKKIRNAETRKFLTCSSSVKRNRIQEVSLFVPGS